MQMATCETGTRGDHYRGSISRMMVASLPTVAPQMREAPLPLKHTALPFGLGQPADGWSLCDVNSTKEDAVQHIIDEVSYINDAEAVAYEE